MTNEQIAGLIKYGILGLLTLIFVFGSFGTIGAGERGIKTRFGAVIGTVEQGLYFKLPVIEHVTTMDVKARTITYEKGENGNGQLGGASKDLQDVAIGVVTTYHVDPTKVSNIFAQYSSVDNYETNVIEPIIKKVTKAITAQYTAEEIVTKRGEINAKVLTVLTEELNAKDAIVENFSITNFDFSEAFARAIEAKVTAVQNAEAQKNKLEQVKYEAQQTIETAKATAEAQRISAQALAAQGGSDYVKLQWINAWKEGGSKVPTIINGGNGSGFLMNIGDMTK